MPAFPMPKRTIPFLKCPVCGEKNPQVETRCTECGTALPEWLAMEPGREFSILLRYRLGASDKQYLVAIDREETIDGRTVYAVNVAFGTTGKLGPTMPRGRFEKLPLAQSEAEKITCEKIAGGYHTEAYSL